MSRPGQPTPNTAPNPTTPEHPVLSRVGGLALTALGGYALHKGFHAEVFGNPAEAMGTPAGEVIEATVIASTIAITGLRTCVTDARLGIASHRAKKAEEAEEKAEQAAKLIKNSNTRIMQGRYKEDRRIKEVSIDLSLPAVKKRAEKRAKDNMKNFKRIRDGKPVISETNDKDGDRTPQDIKSTRRSILHPFREPGITPSRSWRHNRAVNKMVRQRNKRNKIENEEYSTRRWMGNGTHFETDYRNPEPLSATDDLGTVIGWKRFMQTPRTRLEVRGYRRAVKTATHEHHHADKITETTHEKTVGRAEAKVERIKERKVKQQRKIEKLQDKKERIAAREDIPSRIYDKTKSKAKSGAIKTGRAGRKWARGISKAPDTFRDAQNGRVGNSGRLQNRMNRLARNLGQRRARSSASTS